MKLSSFNVYTPDFPEPGQTLVHNTLSGAAVVIESQALASLSAMSEADGPLPEEMGELAAEDVGVAVESLALEEKRWHSWMEEFRHETRRLSALVCVSYACNMECPYCCQEQYMNGQQMKPETAERVASFLVRRFEEVGYPAVTLSFVGGEPLVNLPAILTISRRVRDAARARGAEFRMGMLTNASLLDEEREALLLEAGLTELQVSIDGDRETHNVSRPLKRGGDSFGVVWANTTRISRKVPVNVVGNFTPESAPGFRSLIARMKAEGLTTRELPRIRFKPVMAGLATVEGRTPEACTWSGAGPDLILAMSDMVREAGFDPGPLDRAGPCAFYDAHHVTIDPAGQLLKCPGFLGAPGWEAGDVEHGFNDRWRQFVAAKPYRECGSCAHRPECAGGCVASEWLRTGRMEGVNCEMEFMETVGRIQVQRAVRGDATSDSTGERLEAIARKYAGRANPVPRDEGVIAASSLVRRDHMERAA